MRLASTENVKSLVYAQVSGSFSSRSNVWKKSAACVIPPLITETLAHHCIFIVGQVLMLLYHGNYTAFHKS
jgi:hypothetical protein